MYPSNVAGVEESGVTAHTYRGLPQFSEKFSVLEVFVKSMVIGAQRSTEGKKSKLEDGVGSIITIFVIVSSIIHPSGLFITSLIL